MTTSLEAMKAARGRLQDLRESEFYWGKFLAGTRCGIREALTLLDAAIQREEAQPPSGVVSRGEAIQDVAKRAWVSGYEQGHHDTVETGYYDPASQWDDDEQLRSDVLGADPSEPEVPRSKAMEAILDALTFDARWPDEAKDLFDRWRRETADRIAARILDGEARDGE